MYLSWTNIICKVTTSRKQHSRDNSMKTNIRQHPPISLGPKTRASLIMEPSKEIRILIAWDVTSRLLMNKCRMCIDRYKTHHWCKSFPLHPVLCVPYYLSIGSKTDIHQTHCRVHFGGRHQVFVSSHKTTMVSSAMLCLCVSLNVVSQHLNPWVCEMCQEGLSLFKMPIPDPQCHSQSFCLWTGDYMIWAGGLGV
jgi:hypothetical protein